MTSNCFGALSFCLNFDPLQRVPWSNSEKIFPKNNSPLVPISVFNIAVFASHLETMRFYVLYLRAYVSIFTIVLSMFFLRCESSENLASIFILRAPLSFKYALKMKEHFQDCPFAFQYDFQIDSL